MDIVSGIFAFSFSILVVMREEFKTTPQMSPKVSFMLAPIDIGLKCKHKDLHHAVISHSWCLFTNE